MKKIFILASALLLVGAGCAKQVQNNNSNSVSETVPLQNVQANGTTNDSPDDTHEGIEDGHIVQLAGSRISLDKRNSLKPGEVTLQFKLFGRDAHEFGTNDLTVTHEKRMHLLIIRDDMTNFQHVHPEYINDKWMVKTTIVAAGDYNIYVDIDPEEEDAIVLRVPIRIGEAASTKQFPEPNSDASALSGKYKAVLVTSESTKSKNKTPLTFVITKNGVPVPAIDPYLGAYGHVVLARHNDADDLFHVHPVTETKPANGKVEFEAVFPVKGRYTLYAQFKIDGIVQTFPITVDVTEVGTSAVAPHEEGGSEIHK